MYPLIGEQNVIYIGTMASVVAYGICYIFREKLDFQNMEKRNLVVWHNNNETVKEMEIK